MLFVPDPDPDFLPIPDPGPRIQKGTGSGSATLVQDEVSIKLLHCQFTGEPAPGGSDPPHQPEEDHRWRAELAPEAALPGRRQRQGGGPLQASSMILEKGFFRVSIFRKCIKNFFMYAFLDRKMEQLPVRRQPMSLSSQTGLVILEKLHESGSKYLTLLSLLRRSSFSKILSFALWH